MISLSIAHINLKEFTFILLHLQPPCSCTQLVSHCTSLTHNPDLSKNSVLPASLPVWVHNYGKINLWHKWWKSDGEETLSELLQRFFWNLSVEHKGLRGLAEKSTSGGLLYFLHQNCYGIVLGYTLHKVHVSTKGFFFISLIVHI